MKITKFLIMIYFGAAVMACGDGELKDATVVASSTDSMKVEIRKVDGKYRLYRGGEEYYINGAGLEFGDIASLAAHGANSFRTWRTDNGRDTALEILDQAHQHGLSVTMGIEIAREREGQGVGYFGFDYDDEDAIAEQMERVRAEVMQLKDHPALLIWGIGNELNLGSTNPKVWNAVNDLSKMIHEIDPNHLTTTTLAGFNKELADDIREHASDLDLISIQMYEDIVNLPRYLDEASWNGPYMVTEWGATGHWEVDKTPWGAPLENNSTTKADAYADRYETAIAADAARCVGSYVFLWGQKQERTPTWYGIFLESGESTEVVDNMYHIWNGSWPDNRTPKLTSATLNDKVAEDGIYLVPSTIAEAMVRVSDPESDQIRYLWDIRHESTDLGEGGDEEEVPEDVSHLLKDPSSSTTSFTVPETAGAYRLFVYAFDGQGHAAHANIPFFVKD